MGSNLHRWRGTTNDSDYVRDTLERQRGVVYPSQELTEASLRKWQALQAVREAHQVTMNRSAFRNYTIKIFLCGFLSGIGAWIATLW